MRLLLLFALAVSSAYSAITVQTSTLGNLFLVGETVSIPITGGPVTWQCKSYFGAVVATGNSTTVIEPGVTEPGYYDIWNGATLITSFGIIAPFSAPADSKLGVHTHFAQGNDPAVMPLLARAGIRQLRDEQYWANIENPRGTYNYPVKFTDYMAKATTNGVTPVICLTWGHNLYDFVNGSYFTAPYTDDGRLGYANYALNVVNKYPQVKEVEVWNEYNAGTFITGPATANKPLYYKLMLQKVYETIKPTHPNVQVVAGATVPVAHGYLQKLFAQGAMPFLDAVSVHYPNYIEIEIDDLRKIIKAANGGLEKPIWVTEFSTFAFNTADQYAKASYVAQAAVRMLSARVDRMYYYLLMDDGNFPYMGLVGSASLTYGKFRPHPSLIVYANVIRQISGATYQSRFATSPSVYALRFQRGADQLLALWSTRPVRVAISTGSDLQMTDMMGGTSTITPVDGKVSMALNKDVRYIVGPITDVTETANNLLADSVADYSNTAGANGWSYGWASLASTAAWNPALFQPMGWAIWGGDNYRWIKPGAQYPFAYGHQMHPSSYWAIRRWTSSYAGPVLLTGDFSRGPNGDGTGIRIFVDGTEVFTAHVAPNQAKTAYSIPVTLVVGSKVDYTINQVGASDYDATNLTSQIINRTPAAPENLAIVSP